MHQVFFNTNFPDYYLDYLLIEKRDLHTALHDPTNLELLSQIRDETEFHRLDFQAVIATVVTDYDLKDFDFYFDYVVQLIESLKSALERKASSDH